MSTHRTVLGRQTWADVVFLHWRAAVQDVVPLLPPGTRPDVHDGSTWVGVVGLRMTGLRLLGVPWAPFLELNVRLYSVDDEGRPGVVFRSMEANDPVFVAASRGASRLPYTVAAMRLARTGRGLGYLTRRRAPGPVGVGVRFSVRTGEPLAPGPLEAFLTERWALHQQWYGPTVRVPVAHPPWPLRSGELLGWADDGLLAACGLPGVSGPPEHVVCSDGTTAVLGAPERVARA